MGQIIPRRTRSILIVEDEALIRFELIDFFEDAGFTVSEAENADEAIAILKEDSSIQVVLTDVQMPGSMDGIRLAHHIRDRHPPTLLVVTSGVRNPVKSDLPTDCFFVPKPINNRQVLGRIEQMMLH